MRNSQFCVLVRGPWRPSSTKHICVTRTSSVNLLLLGGVHRYLKKEVYYSISEGLLPFLSLMQYLTYTYIKMCWVLIIKLWCFLLLCSVRYRNLNEIAALVQGTLRNTFSWKKVAFFLLKCEVKFDESLIPWSWLTKKIGIVWGNGLVSIKL